MLACVKKFWLEAWKYTTRMTATTMMLASRRLKRIPARFDQNARPPRAFSDAKSAIHLLLHDVKMLPCHGPMLFQYKKYYGYASVEALLAGAPTVHRVEQFRLFSFGIEPFTAILLSARWNFPRSASGCSGKAIRCSW